MPDIFATDLDSLTLTTINTWIDRVITVKDWQNLTEARLQKLRDLTAQAQEKPPAPTVDAGKLQDRLRDLSPISSVQTLSSNDSDTSILNLENDDLIAAKDAYNTLLSMGGRPMCPLQCNHELDRHRYGTGHLRLYPNEGARLRGELERWRAFRDYQRAVRRDQTSFHQLQKYVDTYWKRRNIRQELKPQLLLDLQLQTQPDEWKEFYFHQHQRLGQKEKEIRDIQAQMSSKAWKEPVPYCKDGLHAEDGWYHAATADLEVYNGWLAWIEGQIPRISSECTAKEVSRAASSLRTTRNRLSRPRQLSRNDTTKVRPPVQSKQGLRHTARVSKASKSEEPFQRSRPICKTPSSINSLICEDTLESVPARILGSIYVTEFGEMDKVFKQPLRRSVRLACRQPWSGYGSTC